MQLDEKLIFTRSLVQKPAFENILVLFDKFRHVEKLKK